MNQRHSRKARGATLLLTILVLLLSVTTLSHLMLRTTIDRLETAAGPFAAESQWIADGIARQWQQKSRSANFDVDTLLRDAHWSFDSSAGGPRITVDIHPTSTQNKLHLPSVDAKAWMQFWQKQPRATALAENADRQLMESGNAALEVILSPQYVSAQTAYKTYSGTALADWFTVWGDGKVDLNRCPLEILRLRLKGMTDAQLNGIIRIRSQGDIVRIESLAKQLNLSDNQRQLLVKHTTTWPSCIEMVILVKKGSLRALYHAVVTLGDNGKVLEVRPIL